ncbi:MAG: excinuclease ABC subunit A, partial [Verrucomicrobia bacterium]
MRSGIEKNRVYRYAVPRRSPSSTQAAIQLRGCHQHNLQHLDIDIPHGKLTVITGPSGSGKSSLAFHTLYAEGQRRYVETFSPYVRQFFDRMDKPQVESITGIPPAIAIEQKNHVRTTRSTVGTLTEINDYLKLLYPKLAVAYDPIDGSEVRPDLPEAVAEWAMRHADGQSIHITFELPKPSSMTVCEWFDSIHQQGFLRLLHAGNILRTDEPCSVDVGQKVEVIQDRLQCNARQKSRLLESIEAAFVHGRGHLRVHTANNGSRGFSIHWHNPNTGFSIRPPTPALFSFNSPVGACPQCRGFGRVIDIDLEKAVPDHSLSVRGGAIKPFQGERGEEFQRELLRHGREGAFDVSCPWEDLTDDEREWILYGERSGEKMTIDLLDSMWEAGEWVGVKGFFDWLETRAYKMHVRIFLARYRSYTTCSACRGKRLQPESLCFKIAGKTLPDLWAMPVNELQPWIAQLMAEVALAKMKDPTLRLILDEVHSRLSYLDQVGLGYLTLDRPTRTLSGGEIERVNLTTCLGASLTGTLFVLDEPTVGLHARDIHRLVDVMHRLRDKGNTLVVVEHESAVMHAADHLIDIGPGAGQYGGLCVYQGPLQPKKCPDLGTLPWLHEKKFIALPKARRKPSKAMLSIRGATQHNLCKLDVDIPLNRFVCLTGVSGSGKSTLAYDVIYLHCAKAFGEEIEDDPARIKSLTGVEQISGVELVDQSPIARTPRSTPAVFLGAFELIRELFSMTDSAVAAGLKAGFFSFNSGDGRCDRCSGNGYEKVEMQFLSDVYVICPDCNGTRYKPSTLEHRWRGKSIADVLGLTVSETLEWLAQAAVDLSGKELRLVNQIAIALRPLVRVGLGYLTLGQPLNTLSGGESQRLKLCQLLVASAANSKSKPLLLILDEPTTGLHFSDIENLLEVFQQLVDGGHSLLIIEHHLDVIKSADWVLDLGPEAGKAGGTLIGSGTPEKIAQSNSATGEFLRDVLEPKSQRKTKRTSQPKPIAASEHISLKGARHHNLKNISLEIPREKIVVISGLSGSGKSTLAFDILFAEGQRRFLDSMSAYARQFAEQLEKPELDQLQGLPPTVAIEQRVSQGSGKSTVATITEVWNFVRLLYAKIGTIYCPTCQVPVEKQSHAALENRIRSELKHGPVVLLAPLIRGKKGYHTEVAQWAIKHGFDRLLVDKQFIDAAEMKRLERFKEHDIDVVVATISMKDDPNLSRSLARALEIGSGMIKLFTAQKKFVLLSTKACCPSCDQSFEDLDPRLFSFNSPHGWCPTCRGHGRIPKRHQLLDLTKFNSVLEAEIVADHAISRMDDSELIECPACHGSRLNSVGANVRVFRKDDLTGTSIADLANQSIHQAAAHFQNLTFANARDQLIARDILPEIHQRLQFLQEVGLGYLQLNRSGNTLSGGESQRIRLAAQLGSNLRGVLYVLDEPTIGLHPRDNVALLKTLTALRKQGNSLVIVEHDEDTIAAADHLIDLGPAAGRLGGQVVYQGKPPVLGKNHFKPAQMLESPTLRALLHPMVHPSRGSRRPISKKHPLLEIKGCKANNLKSIDVAIPLGRLIVLTGVSGSGKSSLMHECIAEAAAGARGKRKQPSFAKVLGAQAIKAVYEVDQSPIGKTSRSCPATYVKVFDAIRALFAQLPEARIRGYDASRFSFNTDGGRCPECKGNGRVKLEMDFLPSTWVPCESCGGQRYNPSTLEVLFRDRSIAQVLAMTIDEAAEFFSSQPRIAHALRLMADTGLGYLQLGQPSPTLSGGEAQRIK